MVSEMSQGYIAIGFTNSNSSIPDISYLMIGATIGVGVIACVILKKLRG